MPKAPTVPKFVTFGSPASPERVSLPDMTNTFLLVAIAGGILIVYALSRVISLQRRIKDLEARPPMDDIVMRSIIRQEVSALVKQPQEPPSSIDATKAEYVPASEYPRTVFSVSKTKDERVVEMRPLDEVRSEVRPFEVKPLEVRPFEVPNVETDEQEEEEEEEPPSPPKKVTKRKSKSKKSEVDLSSDA